MFSQYQGLQYLAGIIPNDVNSFANHFNHPGMMDQFNPGFQHGRGAPGGQFNPGFHQGNGQHFMQHQGTLPLVLYYNLKYILRDISDC
jgi:hypothetical protein